MLIRNVMLLAAILIEVVELPLRLDSRTDYLPAVTGNQRAITGTGALDAGLEALT